MHTIPLATTPNTSAEAVVDLDAIASNIRVLRERAGDAAVMAVVKADGYGHGATRVARTALAAGAAELGVATIDEALALRRDGITAPVLSWLHAPGSDFALALQSDIQIAVSSVRQLGELLDAVRRTGITASVTVKVDTGLNRNGVSAAEYPVMLDALLRAQADSAIRVRGLMSHMVHADDPEHPTNDLQAQRFSDMLEQARAYGVRYEIAHLSNSPAAMSRPDLAYDMVRPGIAVYGLSPIPERGQMGLVPAMTLRCSVALVKSVRAGEGVSYGHIWVSRPRRDARADADRLRRRRIPGAERSVRRIDQRSAATQCRTDLHGPVRRRPRTEQPEVREGDTAVLFGPGTDGEPTAQDWAYALDTIHYEVVTSPRGRVTRVYREGGTFE